MMDYLVFLHKIILRDIKESILFSYVLKRRRQLRSNFRGSGVRLKFCKCIYDRKLTILRTKSAHPWWSELKPLHSRKSENQVYSTIFVDKKCILGGQNSNHAKKSYSVHQKKTQKFESEGWFCQNLQKSTYKKMANC
jgi:hypothetical protein